ncbi:leucine-rich repeat extensin-like protein 7 [Iris pallida]|uniref:Leucine-rich repeat extensin-like protein 7 n=1 Tax=Iris pallida TaxID=29817 RepID=A0AAX6IAJ6_IRIPA|nr:leucine-rich repeat extensin-like protein 7 [Iris pallida]
MVSSLSYSPWVVVLVRVTVEARAIGGCDRGWRWPGRKWCSDRFLETLGVPVVWMMIVVVVDGDDGMNIVGW